VPTLLASAHAAAFQNTWLLLRNFMKRLLMLLDGVFPPAMHYKNIFITNYYQREKNNSCRIIRPGYSTGRLNHPEPLETWSDLHE
jgi:hypothetical protein